MIEPRPIWVKEPYPPCFPEDPKLAQLLGSNYYPRLGRFKLRMKRRHARDLRKGLFGPKGSRNVPDKEGGAMNFALPNGWTLRLTYHPARGGDPERGWEAGDVDAEFIPPRPLKSRLLPRQQPAYSVAEAHP